MAEIIEAIEEKKKRLIRYYEDPKATADNWKATGKSTMGYLCSYVPEEILFAAGILPIRVLGHLENVSLASSYFQPFVCRLIRSALERGISGSLNYTDGIIISYTCDGMRMLYDTWVENVPSKFTYLLDLPSSLDRGPNHRSFQRNMLDLIASVEKYKGSKIKEKDLQKTIAVYNKYRRLAKELYRLHQTEQLPQSDVEYLKIQLAALMAPKDAFSEELETYLQLLKEWTGKRESDKGPKKIPIHLTGSLAVDPVFYDLIDKAGGKIVSNDLCTGTRYFWDEVDENGDPIESIAARYLNRVTCPSKYPAINRPTFLEDRIREGGAKGTIILGEKFCDPHLFEIPAVRKRIESLGGSTLWLETELAFTGREQLETRLEAFIDILRGKEENNRR